MSLASLFLFAVAPLPDGSDMLVGRETAYTATLLSDQPGQLYGLQFTPRSGRFCLVRAYFRGDPPQTASFCTGRVTEEHHANGAAAIAGYGEIVTGLGACLDDRGRLAAARLQLSEGYRITARWDACVGDWDTAWCRPGWRVQGVQLYFDGAYGGWGHRRLTGLRPLCTAT